MEYKGQHYEEAEPRLFDLRLRVLAASMGLMALALLIRGERAFGKIAGREYVYNPGTSLTEGLSMALGVSLATVVVLLFWDAKARRSWEFAGLIIGAGLEGFNSFLSATMSTGAVTWLVSREFTMFVLSVGSVMAWVIAGKLFAQAYSRHLKEYRAWHRRATAWYNSLVAVDVAEAERQERLRTLREERHQRKQELQKPQGASVTPQIVTNAITKRDWRKYVAGLLESPPTRNAALLAMIELGLDAAAKANRDKVNRWWRETYQKENE